MKINTLEYIHKLLLANAESMAATYRGARDNLNGMEDFQLTLDEPELLESYKRSTDKQKAYVDECWKARCAADAALEDFENQEW